MIAEKITASMASIPTRAESLQSAVDSLVNQVDELVIYLNDWLEIPGFLKNRKIRILKGDNLGDTGKFYGVQSVDGFVFTVDDDLIYPVNSVEEMIEKIDQYDRLAFVCVHGNLIPKEPIKSYYGEKKGVHFSKELKADTRVDVPGTGTLAYHSSLYRADISDFERKNMTDIWLYKIAKCQNIPVISIARQDQWIKLYSPACLSESIYQASHKDDWYQTSVINQIINQPGIDI
tara:strand:- start:8350 stop:9048 length:699 start_codon:yes stop_codon:yes gene_type:complete